MFIKPPKAKEKTVRLSFVLPESKAELFNQYLLYVTEVAGHEVPAKEVLQLMVEAAMTADRGFLKFQKAVTGNTAGDSQALTANPSNFEDGEEKPTTATAYSFN